jgi:FkbH-like protein
VPIEPALAAMLDGVAPLALATVAARSDGAAAHAWASQPGRLVGAKHDVNAFADALLSSRWAMESSSGGPLLALLAPLKDSLTPGTLVRLAELGLRDGFDADGRALLDAALARKSDDTAALRLASELAIRDGRGAEAHALLTRLAVAEPHGATVQAVQRKRGSIPEDGPATVRIALLSSFTIEPLAAWVDLEVRRIGLRPELYLAPFNAIPLEILNPQSGLYAAQPDIVFLSSALDDLAPELAGPTAAEELEAIGARVLDELVGHVRTFTERSNATVVVHSFTSEYIGQAVLDWRSGGRGRWLQALNARLVEQLAAMKRVHVLDLEQVRASRHGGAADDVKMRYMAGMRLSDAVGAAVAQRYARYVVALKGLTKKCLVLDLDNTLWGGIVGEDGPNGIRLGNTAPGIEYHEFQQAIAGLSRRGILLALNSKNNPEDALEVIRQHPWMVLREQAFSVVRINWQSKVENLREIASELNIGLDSLVFMDDNPVECEQVRQMLPEVVTVQMPRDPSRYRATLEALPWFDAFEVTAEDLKRVEQYRSNRERTVLRERTGSVTDYLQSLGIRVRIATVDASTVGRVAQLLTRTNQFNLTTQRHTQADLERWMSEGGWRILTVNAADRFGDHGLVAVAIVECGTENWRIDSFLMSCRVIGQGIETALLAEVHDGAVAAGASRLLGEFRPTKKNAQVKEFFEGYGFTVLSTETDGSKTLALPLPAALTSPMWIERST